MEQIDYTSIADLYDLFVAADYDFDFFTGEFDLSGAAVLELTSGTGRLSLPLIESGADLTCVDLSSGMLEVLNDKLRQKNLTARVICDDIANLTFSAEFDLAILPFQSFMELIGKEVQEQVLGVVYQALKPGGKFICTMHNPPIRRQVVDGILRVVGHFPKDGGTLIVSGFEQGGRPVVTRHQLFEFYNGSGILQWKRMLRMHFEFITKEQFQGMASAAGFHVAALYGDYQRRSYAEAESPVMIWVLEKPVLQ